MDPVAVEPPQVGAGGGGGGAAASGGAIGSPVGGPIGGAAGPVGGPIGGPAPVGPAPVGGPVGDPVGGPAGGVGGGPIGPHESFIPTDHQNISARKPSQFYVNRIRKMLQHHKTVTCEAVGAAMSVLVEAVEILKRERVAKVVTIATSQVSLERHERNNVRKPKLNIVVERGEKALLLYGYRKRKVLELFDHLYQQESGAGLQELKYIDMDFNEELSLDFIRQFSFSALLPPDQENRQTIERQANEYLNGLAANKDKMDLEEWTQYLSFLVAPTLSNKVFDDAVQQYLETPAQ